MLIENSFEVPAALDTTWTYLLDVERVVVCMPGAELTETIDDRNWKGRVKVRLGPVSLSFAGKVTMTERDDDAHRVVLQGSGMEQRGKGRASVTITTTAEQTSGGTRVQVVQDLQVQGQVASMSRGMMQDVSSRLTKQFADCLEANLRAEQGEPSGVAAAQPSTAPEPVPAPSASEAPGALPAEGDEAAVAARAEAEHAAAPPPTSATRPAPVARAGEVRGLSLFWGAVVGAIRRVLARLVERLRTRA